MLGGRGVFDKETRRKPLALAADAELYPYIWSLNACFAVCSLRVPPGSGAVEKLRSVIVTSLLWPKLNR